MIEEDKLKYYLGIDLSTQSLKFCVIDENFRQVYNEKINYCDILPSNHEIIHFFIENGQSSAEQDVFLFIKSIEISLKRLNDEFGKKIQGVSVSGQQHGSVYYANEIQYDNKKDLEQNLSNTFSTRLCPIWMDSSTSNQCKEMQDKFKWIHQKTGSRPFERFTYSQILKKFQFQRQVYDSTIHISLISSFVAEILTGKFVSIDYGDASGMNLMDLKSKKYIKEMIDYIPQLEDKLGKYEPIESWTSVGNINPYFISNYSLIFDSQSIVIASTGDNLASMVGMGLLNSSDLAISLGTSDTLFGLINQSQIDSCLNPNTPIFASPLSPDEYLLLLCQKNGGIMREETLVKYSLTWSEVESYYFNQYKPKGFYGCFLQQPEIVPAINSINPIKEIKNVNEDIDVSTLTPIEKCILLLEYKLISLKLNYQNQSNKLQRLILTGGACKNKIMQQMAANIFNCEVFIQETEDSAALGSALRAYHGSVTCLQNDYAHNKKYIEDASIYKLSKVAQPQHQYFDEYFKIQQAIQKLEINLSQKYPY